ncbi:histidine kinase [Candidatus Scalindua japonica]|uniref:Histidine kinase n=1 Tax=Candidatus Scalindua japonica TaxID=1284222 RepID=A0A286TWW2_9BACT|nr:response regulator [Candidatus Scalindua japonica]GAX60373.1 histidine kinase [Candidatus Scalindua japonica]
MKEIIKWLRGIEHLAGEMYHQAASIYSDDDVFKKFLEHNAEDEAWHYHVMGSAALFLDSEPDFTVAISIDKETNEKIINQISTIKNGLEQNTLSKDELINKIVELELSEWNDVFLYAVNFLKDKTSEFKYPAARIQAHIKEIEHFLRTVERKSDALQKIKELPPIWIENILIVDDEELITDLIKSLLNRSGNIDVAHNGKEAFKLIKRKFYKLIIADIDMPIMDGLSFYQNTIEEYPTSSNRFLFMTGDLSSERKAYFDQNRVKYLAKPMDISVLREEAAKIIISK